MTISVRETATGRRYRLPWRRTLTLHLQVLFLVAVSAVLLAAGIFLPRANVGPGNLGLVTDAFSFLLFVA